MNSEKTPAELLEAWNASRSRGHHVGLSKEQFEHYYPNVDFDKRHEIGQVLTEVIAESEDSEAEQSVSVEMPVEEAIQEQVNQYVPDVEAEQLVNEINNKADPAQELVEEPFEEDPIETKNKQAVSKIIREIDLHNKTAFFKFAHGSKAKFNELKPEIIDLLNRIKHDSDLFVKVFSKLMEKLFQDQQHSVWLIILVCRR